MPEEAEIPTAKEAPANAVYANHGASSDHGAAAAHQHVRSDASAGELEQALGRKDWPMAVQLVGENWPTLLNSHTSLLDRALRAIPFDEATRDPRTAAVRDIRLHTSADEVDRMLGEALLPDVEDFSSMDEIARSPRALNLLSVASARMIALRVRGNMTRAAQLAQLVERYGRIAVVHQPAIIAARLPAALLQVGITRGLADDAPNALIVLRDAYERGTEARSSYIRRDAAGKSALFLALSGDVDQAEHWMRLWNTTPSNYEWIESRVSLTANIARSIIATESARHDQASAALSGLDQPVNAEQSWGPIVTYARARYALAWGDQREAIDMIRLDRKRYSDWLGHGATMGPMLALAEADLLLSLSRHEPARQATSVYDGHPLAQVSTMRVELAAANYDSAARVAADVLNSGYSTRARIEARAVLAVLDSASRDLPGHDDEYRRLDAVAQAKGMKLTTWGMPLSNREEPQSVAVPPRRTLPTPSDRTVLTARQLDVLQGIEKGQTLREISDAQHLSMNTVKTHAAALYRRLGVSSRDAAVARAREAGLL